MAGNTWVLAPRCLSEPEWTRLDFVTTSNALVFALYFSIGNSPRRLGDPSRGFPASALCGEVAWPAMLRPDLYISVERSDRQELADHRDTAESSDPVSS